MCLPISPGQIDVWSETPFDAYIVALLYSVAVGLQGQPGGSGRDLSDGGRQGGGGFVLLLLLP